MRTQFFMHRMLMAYDTVLAVRSHQHALICVEIYGAVALNLLRHRRDACSTAWRCRFLPARPYQHGRIVAEK